MKLSYKNLKVGNTTLLTSVYRLIVVGDPPGTVFYREYPVPLPRISPRLVCGVRSWIPEYCTPDGTSGEITTDGHYVCRV